MPPAGGREADCDLGDSCQDRNSSKSGFGLDRNRRSLPWDISPPQEHAVEKRREQSSRSTIFLKVNPLKLSLRQE